MRRKPQKTNAAKDEVSLQELDGLCEMGMQGEILRMVERLLSRRPLSALLFNEAFVEIAAARAAQATEVMNDGLSHIRSLRKAAKDELAITLPGNFKARLDEAEMELILFKAALDQCLPSGR